MAWEEKFQGKSYRLSLSKPSKICYYSFPEIPESQSQILDFRSQTFHMGVPGFRQGDSILLMSIRSLIFRSLAKISTLSANLRTALNREAAPAYAFAA